MIDYICEKCGALIPRARRELLPDTTTCVGCSDVKAKTVSDLPLDHDPNELNKSFQGQQVERNGA